MIRYFAKNLIMCSNNMHAFKVRDACQGNGQVVFTSVLSSVINMNYNWHCGLLTCFLLQLLADNYALNYQAFPPSSS